MAAFDPAVENTLRWEDSTLSGKVTYDSGGMTKWGLAKKWNPEVTPDLTLAEAKEIYKRKYWIPLCSELQSQAVANKLFDMTVNIGLHHAVMMLQCALNQSGCLIHEDGQFGRQTVDACNEVPEVALLSVLKSRLKQYYEAIVDHQPAQAKYLKGWLRRAEG
jgi:lysozyme family protein